MIQVVAVVGPTASGKTDLALDLAERLGTEIVSADSMQFYRGFEIGTGAPSTEERARVKHHFVGHLDPSEEMSAGSFEVAAAEVVQELNARGKTAVVVGGSGLYVQALIDGLFEGPSKDESIRGRLEREAEEQGAEGLYARLESLDPDYARRTEPGDLRRVVRALEVYEISGRRISELHTEHRAGDPRFESVQIAIDWPRAELYERIHARVDCMLEDGLVQEVQSLIAAGHESNIHRLRSIGYREIAAHLAGETTLGEAIEIMKMHTRRYAKRQLTWFRGDSRVHWLEASGDESSAFHLERVLKILQSHAKLPA